MTASEQLAAALKALDEARRSLEILAASPCGDSDIDDAIDGALEDIDGHIGNLHSFHEECVLGPDMGDFHDPADSFPNSI